MSKRQLPIYGIKHLDLGSNATQDLDTGSRTAKVYFAAFDIMDSDNDIIKPGAFAKSIQENGPASDSNRNIQFLRNHNWDEQIGKVLELSEDDYGLLGVVQFGRTQKGEEAFLDYQDGIIKEHSIGFNYISDKMEMREDGKGGVFWEIKEVKLWEGSAVTFGSNQFTPVVDVAKGLTKEAAIDTLNKEMGTIIGALKNGKGSDDRLFGLEMKLKVVTQKYNALLEQKPPVKALLKQKPQFDTENFYRLLIQ